MGAYNMRVAGLGTYISDKSQVFMVCILFSDKLKQLKPEIYDLKTLLFLGKLTKIDREL